MKRSLPLVLSMVLVAVGTNSAFAQRGHRTSNTTTAMGTFTPAEMHAAGGDPSMAMELREQKQMMQYQQQMAKQYQQYQQQMAKQADYLKKHPELAKNLKDQQTARPTTKATSKTAKKKKATTKAGTEEPPRQQRIPPRPPLPPPPPNPQPPPPARPRQKSRTDRSALVVHFQRHEAVAVELTATFRIDPLAMVRRLRFESAWLSGTKAIPIGSDHSKRHAGHRMAVGSRLLTDLFRASPVVVGN